MKYSQMAILIGNLFILGAWFQNNLFATLMMDLLGLIWFFISVLNFMGERDMRRLDNEIRHDKLELSMVIHRDLINAINQVHEDIQGLRNEMRAKDESANRRRK